MSKKLLITDKDVGIIEDFAHIAFRKRPTFGTMSSKEMQAFCLLEGFAMFLGSKGVEIPFELQGFVQEDCESLDGGFPDEDPDEQKG
jgi:hypothetical protein